MLVHGDIGDYLLRTCGILLKGKWISSLHGGAMIQVCKRIQSLRDKLSLRILYRN